MKLRPYQDENGTWRCDGVPICSTGIEYPLASGPKTFTEDDLVDIVSSQGDSAIKVPRIKLGHSSAYNAALVGDAEQAFGRVENLKVGNSGQTIYGDYVGMPEWLAKILPIAYPSRSIEGWPDVETVTGHQWKAVVSAVSLLGVQWPGVSTLEDLPLYYGSEIPPGVEIDSALTAKNGGGMKPGERMEAAVDIDLVDRAFYTEYATGDQYWWWIRGRRYDDTTGLQLIVDCDPDPMIVRIPVSVSGSDVNFGDSVEVTEEYPDKTPVAASAFVAGMAAVELSRGADMVVFASRADTTSDRPAIRATNEGGTMDDATRRALATRVGLDPETATEDEINTRIDEMRGAAEAGGGDGGEGGEGGEDGNGGAGDGGDGGEDPALEAGNGNNGGVVQIDAERLARIEAGAAKAERLEREAIQREDEAILTAAIKAGKFSPARREHYGRLLASDREGAKQLIDSLEGGLVPMDERGSAGNGQGGNAGEGGEDDGLLGMDSTLDRDIKAARDGEIRGKSHHGRVMNAREA